MRQHRFGWRSYRPVAVNVPAQLVRGRVDTPRRQMIHDAAVSFHADLPLGLLHALAKPLKEHTQQVSEGHERL